jgi:hypothetical protein
MEPARAPRPITLRLADRHLRQFPLFAAESRRQPIHDMVVCLPLLSRHPSQPRLRPWPIPATPTLRATTRAPRPVRRAPRVRSAAVILRPVTVRRLPAYQPPAYRPPVCRPPAQYPAATACKRRPLRPAMLRRPAITRLAPPITNRARVTVRRALRRIRRRPLRTPRPRLLTRRRPVQRATRRRIDRGARARPATMCRASRAASIRQSGRQTTQPLYVRSATRHCGPIHSVEGSNCHAALAAFLGSPWECDPPADNGRVMLR